MGQPSPRDDKPAPDGTAAAAGKWHLPVDPDIDSDEDLRHHPGHLPEQPAAAQRSRWPAVHWGSVAMVGAGGFVGGLARYVVELAWPTGSGTFPWGTFAVNTAGAFVLALLLVAVLEVLPPSTYLRPAVGTGFCGALTTFSSVAVQTDRLTAHGHVGIAVSYLLTSVLAAVAAAMAGLLLGRSIPATRTRRVASEEPT